METDTGFEEANREQALAEDHEAWCAEHGFDPLPNVVAYMPKLRDLLQSPTVFDAWEKEDENDKVS